MLAPTEKPTDGSLRIYGLTGGTGSGKSAAARVFTEEGIPVLNADRIGHELIQPGGNAVQPVREAFGDGIMTRGAIDRGKLGEIVFSDPQARQRLNALMHPLIQEAITERCAQLARKGQELVVIDAALIAENLQKPPSLDGIIVVHCSHQKRVQRLVERAGLSEEQARRRMEAQTPPEQKLAIADWVVENEGTLEEFRAKARQLAKELKQHEV
jgi:dephospho-CoA kinase